MFLRVIESGLMLSRPASSGLCSVVGYLVEVEVGEVGDDHLLDLGCVARREVDCITEGREQVVAGLGEWGGG